MIEQRLSHSYCCDCDVMFIAATHCPRCDGMNLVHPPPGSPPPAPVTIKARRAWIDRDDAAYSR